VDTPDDGAFADRLAAAGLARVDTVATMRRGDRPAPSAAALTFGLISQALADHGRSASTGDAAV